MLILKENVLSEQFVFGLTEKGEREIRLCMLSLSGDAQLVLPLFGKNSTIDEVVAILPPIVRSSVAEIVGQLLAAGYIVQQEVVRSDVAEINPAPQDRVELEKPFCETVVTSNSGTMLETLRELAFFNDFTAAELSEVSCIVSWHEREKNQLILREGEAVDSFFVLLNGAAAVLKDQSPVGVIQQGESFGEFAYIMGEQARHTADVIAKSYVEFLEFPADKLKLATPRVRFQFASAFARIQTQRLMSANEQIVSLLADKYR